MHTGDIVVLFFVFLYLVLVLKFEFGLFSSFLMISIILKLKPTFTFRSCRWTQKSENVIVRVLVECLGDFCRYWHDYEYHGLEEIHDGNRVLLVGYHSRCTLDLFYVASVVRPAVVASYLLFLVSFIGDLFRLCHVIPSKGGGDPNAEKEFINLLTDGKRPVMLLPGGAPECLHTFNRRFRVDWLDEPGYARLIAKDHRLASNISIIPFYTRNCENIYFTTVWWHDYSARVITQWIKEIKGGCYWKLMPLLYTTFFSLGFFLFPLPVKLDTYFGKPIQLKKAEDAKSLATRVKFALHNLMDTTNSLPVKQRHPTRQKWFLVKCIVGLYVLFQNILITAFLFLTLLLTLPAIISFKYISDAVVEKKRREEKDILR